MSFLIRSIHDTPLYHFYERYLGQLGYVSRHIHSAHIRFMEREEIGRRRALAAKARPAPEAARIAEKLEEQGYHVTSLERLGFADALGDYCRALAEPVAGLTLAELAKIRAGTTKPYWLDLYEAVGEKPSPVRDFLTSDLVLDAVCLYVGEVPFLAEANLFYTPAGAATLPPTQQGSQRWHLDRSRRRQVKIFMLPLGADDESGASLILPKPWSDLRRYPNYPRYFTDEEFVAAGLDMSKVVRFTGKPGDVMFVDTSRLFHAGARTRGKPRLQFIANLAPIDAWIPYRRMLRRASPGSHFPEINREILARYAHRARSNAA